MVSFKTKISALFYLKEEADQKFSYPFDVEKSAEKVFLLQKEGADSVHIGAVSPRLGTAAVTVQEEKNSIIPLLKALKGSLPVSVDIVHREVVQEAIAAGAKVLSDLSGFRDPEMRKLAAKSDADICIRYHEHHLLAAQHGSSCERGILTESLDWLDKQARLFLHEGVEPHRLIIDPGIGLGKTCEENLEILRHIQKYRELGFRVSVEIVPLFPSRLLPKNEEHLPVTIALSTFFALSHIDTVRVHNVQAHREAFNLLYAITHNLRERALDF